MITSATLDNKIEVNEVLNGDTHSYVRKSQKANKRDKPKSEIILSSSHVTLTPLRCVGDTIEYKLKYKDMSRPFSKVKVIITQEFKEKDQASVDGMLSRILQMNISDQRATRQSLNPPPPCPDPDEEVSHHPMDSYHA
ncbi:hypothetical protein V5N11_029787 [Cardamine amara subsp. amara]|uniref:Uncharacterized protein n=1 Tax=Cardamine amara subsp. amara TaxID=228776 RepID=A0ABD1C2T6_CARAN